MSRSRNNNIGNKTKQLALCAALSALGVVVIYLGRLLSVMDISMAVIASLFCAIAVIEYGKAAPWLVYAVTGALSLILLPDNTAAWIYTLFFGFYPIIKSKFEKLKKPLAWFLKELIFNVSLAVMLIAEKLLLTADTEEPLILYIIFIILAEVVFPLYDLVLTRLTVLYIRRIQPKFKFK